MANTSMALPEELLAAIASYASAPSLASLAQASRQWNRVAIPHLYRRIDFTDNSEQMNYQRLESLVTQLLQRPQHAVHVEQLRFSGKWPSIPESGSDTRTEPEDLPHMIE